MGEKGERRHRSCNRKQLGRKKKFTAETVRETHFPKSWGNDVRVNLIVHVLQSTGTFFNQTANETDKGSGRSATSNQKNKKTGTEVS